VKEASSFRHSWGGGVCFNIDGFIVRRTKIFGRVDTKRYIVGVLRYYSAKQRYRGLTNKGCYARVSPFIYILSRNTKDFIIAQTIPIEMSRFVLHLSAFIRGTARYNTRLALIGYISNFRA
jgi:hypothetical protein